MKKIFSILALLLMTAVGTTAQTTYTVTVKGGTEDAANWSANPISAGEGQSVTVKYNGTKKVKRVTAAKKAAAHPQAEGHALTAAALGEIVGSDGRAYAVADKDNLPTFVTAVAMVAYVGSETDHATYKHGLAIALSDDGSMMDWFDAKSACGGLKAAFNGASWMLPSEDQWNAMFKAFGGNEESDAGLDAALATAGGDSSKLQSHGYWSSTESDYSDHAWVYAFNFGYWNTYLTDYNYYVRGCLVF